MRSYVNREHLMDTVWQSHTGNVFRVLECWRENNIEWIRVRQLSKGAFEGETFKWALCSLLNGEFKAIG